MPWLVKTFQERRTWFATYLAYYRIFAFHIIWFHVLLALAFAEDPDSSNATFIGRCGAPMHACHGTAAACNATSKHCGVPNCRVHAGGVWASPRLLSRMHSWKWCTHMRCCIPASASPPLLPARRTSADRRCAQADHQSLCCLARFQFDHVPALLLLVLLRLGLPHALPPSPLLGALRPIPLGASVILDCNFLFSLDKKCCWCWGS